MEDIRTRIIDGSMARFEELCGSLGGIGQSLLSSKNCVEAADAVNLANASLSHLRTELEIPRHSITGFRGALVINDYYALTQLEERIGYDNVSCEINDQGRIFALRLLDAQNRIDEVNLLADLEKLESFKYGNTDPSPLVNCDKLTTLIIHGIDPQIEKLESVLKNLHCLRKVVVQGSGPLNLDWASSTRELVRLWVPGLSIKDIAPLANCDNLVSLGLEFNPIRSLAPLKALTNLELLDIRGTNVSDLWSVCEMPSLTELKISPGMEELPGYAECKAAMNTSGGWIIVSE